MYDICITKIGVVPMTRRSDIIKILVIAALLGALFYYMRSIFGTTFKSSSGW